MFCSYIFCIEFYCYLDLLFITVFICFLIIFFCAKKFNTFYLLIPNIVAVVLSQSFNAVIHFINYLCLNWLILVFNLVLVSFAVFIYVRICVRTIRKSFLISYFFLNYFYLTFVVLKVTKFFSFLVRKKVLNFNTFYFVN